MILSPILRGNNEIKIDTALDFKGNTGLRFGELRLSISESEVWVYFLPDNAEKATYMNRYESLAFPTGNIPMRPRIMVKGNIPDLHRDNRELKQENTELKRLNEAQAKIISDYAQSHDPGYVYLMHDIQWNKYKIGKSAKPQNRLSQLRTSSPNEIVLVCTIWTSDMSGLESMLHKWFADQCVNREWFELSEHDVDRIKAMS